MIDKLKWHFFWKTVALLSLSNLFVTSDDERLTVGNQIQRAISASKHHSDRS